jgi:hypothetical protein
MRKSRELDENELDLLKGPGSFLILLYSDSRMGVFLSIPSSTVTAE